MTILQIVNKYARNEVVLAWELSEKLYQLFNCAPSVGTYRSVYDHLRNETDKHLHGTSNRC